LLLPVPVLLPERVFLLVAAVSERRLAAPAQALSFYIQKQQAQTPEPGKELLSVSL
jgi:hypothetical protein